MPNHTTNFIRVTGENGQILAFKDAVSGFTGDTPEAFSAAAVTPMPASVQDTESGTGTDVGLAYHGDENALADVLARPMFSSTGVNDLETLRRFVEVEMPGAVALGLKSLAALKETGHKDWYSWAQEFWGTKWGTYESVLAVEEDGLLEYTFLSAWNPPFPVISKLAEMFPSLKLEQYYLDEGGFFEGAAAYQGKFKAEILPGEPFFDDCHEQFVFVDEDGADG